MLNKLLKASRRYLLPFFRYKKTVGGRICPPAGRGLKLRRRGASFLFPALADNEATELTRAVARAVEINPHLKFFANN